MEITDNYSQKKDDLVEGISKLNIDSSNKHTPSPLELQEGSRNTFFPNSDFYIEADQHSPIKTQAQTPSPISRPLPTPKSKSKTLPRENTSQKPSNRSMVSTQTTDNDLTSTGSGSHISKEDSYGDNVLHHSNSDNLNYSKPNTSKDINVINTRSYDNLNQNNNEIGRSERSNNILNPQRSHTQPSFPSGLSDNYHSSHPSRASTMNESQTSGGYSRSDSESRSMYYDQSRTENSRQGDRGMDDYPSRNSTSSGYPQINPTSPQTEQKSEIPTKEALETYRQNAKKSHDPEVQLDFAKYLIETAALVLENQDDAIDPQTARKLHDSLITEALKWIKRLSSQGIGLGKGAYPEAQFFLANCYNNGSLGLSVDHDKAFNLYVQASKQNHPAATYRTGVCYEFGAGTKRDHHRSLQFFRKAAALGDTAAMFKVGMVLLKGGLGQQPNPREGITWLKRAAAAADEENPHALHELASCYEKGGIPSIIADPSYSRELYTQAAQLGYAHSQFKLGVCYEQGLLTCPIDPRRSIAWFTRGAEQGDPECELALSGWYLTGSEGVLKQSDTEAYLWARKAADKGLAKAEYAVGYYSEVGIGVRQDLEEARRWYMRAAAQGNKRAMQRLSELKKTGSTRKGGPKSKEEAGCNIA
ncbi:HCP-like protein [Neoconidiobolus thromboides FSU 785]|nr:HCP-like protein [Neoconidiobolus thromboides FSU 785]